MSPLNLNFSKQLWNNKETVKAQIVIIIRNYRY